MDLEGFKFLKTLRSNDMDRYGNLAIGSRALRKLPWAPQTNEFRANPLLGLRAFPVQFAPPMFPSYDPPISLPRTIAVDHAPQTLKPFLMSNTQGKSILTKIPMMRVYTDQNLVVLYEDSQTRTLIEIFIRQQCYQQMVTILPQ